MSSLQILSQAARHYLTASALSVAVENMFSVSGLIMNGKRSSLQHFRLNYISFVHDNIAYI